MSLELADSDTQSANFDSLADQKLISILICFQITSLATILETTLPYLQPLKSSVVLRESKSRVDRFLEIQ